VAQPFGRGDPQQRGAPSAQGCFASSPGQPAHHAAGGTSPQTLGHGVNVSLCAQRLPNSFVAPGSIGVASAMKRHELAQLLVSEGGDSSEYEYAAPRFKNTACAYRRWRTSESMKVPVQFLHPALVRLHAESRSRIVWAKYMNTNTRSWSRGICARKSAAERATKCKPAALRSSPAAHGANPWPNTSLNRTPNSVAHCPAGNGPAARFVPSGQHATPSVAG
jgi:hypothetical protein